jgi:hypothetical protein
MPNKLHEAASNALTGAAALALIAAVAFAAAFPGLMP